MHEYLKSLYKPELIRILERLATDIEIYQKILDCRIGDINEERLLAKHLKKTKTLIKQAD